MKTTQRFPQTRNGIRHPVLGPGVVKGVYDEKRVLVSFVENPDASVLVNSNECTSAPEFGESPDPATSRFSGYMGNSYRRKK
jgi:hypothetical protein